LCAKTPSIARKAKPGQFVQVRVVEAYDPLLRRPLSICRTGNGNVELVYQVVGRGTEILATRSKGEMIDLIGPFGRGFTVDAHAGNVLIVSGGCGAAPLLGLAQAYKTANMLVLLGARNRADIILRREFQRTGARVKVATDDGTAGVRGVVSDLAARELNKTGKFDRIYSCGPKPMLKKIASLAKKHRIPCEVSLEELMACGFGVCLSCARQMKSGLKLVCKDGPVFDAQEVIWSAVKTQPLKVGMNSAAKSIPCREDTRSLRAGRFVWNQA